MQWIYELAEHPHASVLIASLITSVVALFVAVLAHRQKNRDLDIKMVELALGILRESPEKSNVKAAREWAADLLERNARLRLSPEARAELLDRPLIISANFDADAFDHARKLGRLDFELEQARKERDALEQGLSKKIDEIFAKFESADRGEAP